MNSKCFRGDLFQYQVINNCNVYTFCGDWWRVTKLNNLFSSEMSIYGEIRLKVDSIIFNDIIFILCVEIKI